MMKKRGFMCGLTLGIIATMVYQTSNKAKKNFEKGKKFMKSKLNNIME